MSTQRGPILSVGGHGVLRSMELREPLGRGTMGTVYLARVHSSAPPGTPSKIAVRVLSSRFHRDPAFMSRFYADATAAGRLQHPNLVRVLDVAEVSGRHCLAMELVEGETLDKLLARAGKLAEPSLIAIGLAVGGALRTAWLQQRLLHHNIRTQNIFMAAGNVVKLADIGLARSVTNEAGHPLPHAPVSDPHYTAPELTMGARAQDCQGDIYALGATLYHLAAGRKPFVEHTGPKVFLQQREGWLPWVKELNPALSPGFCAIVEKMLGRDPQDRYIGYEALVADLKTLSEGGRPSAAVIEPGRSVMTRSKQPPPTAAPPVATPKKRPPTTRPPAIAAARVEAAEKPAKSHHHPAWMTTPVVIGAWVMVFVLIILCILAYAHRTFKQRQLDEEAFYSVHQRQIEDAADAAAVRKLADADDYAKRNPNDVAGIVDRYERVGEFYFSTTAGHTAQEEAKKWRAKLPKQ
ncbi:MAG: serine/threonine protein kinase [Verrucomicrobia bacterium]|nr:serine/threonine protein kinase [Verrucomicrobiota bacterium]